MIQSFPGATFPIILYIILHSLPYLFLLLTSVEYYCSGGGRDGGEIWLLFLVGPSHSVFLIDSSHVALLQ